MPNLIPSIQEHNRVAGFILRLAFADVSALGWDETIKRSPGSTPRDLQYDILVNRTTYRTQKLLSNIGAENLRGRGTRVWAVKKVIHGGLVAKETLVLKDGWVDSNRRREEKILQNIRESTVNGTDKPFDGEANLLTVVDACDVTVNDIVDDTHIPLRDGPDNSLRHEDIVEVKADPSSRKKVTSKLPAVGAAILHMQDRPVPVAYPEKVHHRIVFRELGQTVGELDSLRMVFYCLAQIVYGMSR